MELEKDIFAWIYVLPRPFSGCFRDVLLARTGSKAPRLRTVRAVVADLANQNKEIRLMNMEIQKP